MSIRGDISMACSHLNKVRDRVAEMENFGSETEYEDGQNDSVMIVLNLIDKSIEELESFKYHVEEFMEES